MRSSLIGLGSHLVLATLKHVAGIFGRSLVAGASGVSQRVLLDWFDCYVITRMMSVGGTIAESVSPVTLRPFPVPHIGSEMSMHPRSRKIGQRRIPPNVRQNR